MERTSKKSKKKAKAPQRDHESTESDSVCSSQLTCSELFASYSCCPHLLLKDAQKKSKKKDKSSGKSKGSGKSDRDSGKSKKTKRPEPDPSTEESEHSESDHEPSQVVCAETFVVFVYFQAQNRGKNADNVGSLNSFSDAFLPVVLIIFC